MGHNGFKALAAAADAMSKGRAGLGGRALRVRARRTGVGRTCRRGGLWAKTDGETEGDVDAIRTWTGVGSNLWGGTGGEGESSGDMRSSRATSSAGRGEGSNVAVAATMEASPFFHPPRN